MPLRNFSPETIQRHTAWRNKYLNNYCTSDMFFFFAAGLFPYTRFAPFVLCANLRTHSRMHALTHSSRIHTHVTSNRYDNYPNILYFFFFFLLKLLANCIYCVVPVKTVFIYTCMYILYKLTTDKILYTLGTTSTGLLNSL